MGWLIISCVRVRGKARVDPSYLYFDLFSRNLKRKQNLTDESDLKYQQ